MIQEEVFFDLSLLSYFTYPYVGNSVAQMIDAILLDEDYKKDFESLEYVRMNLDLVADMNVDLYKDMYIKDYFDDNENSGVVYYVFEYHNELIYAFRGSEPFDDIRHETGWQDWQDNFQMFLQQPTYQQIFTLHQLQQTTIDQPFYLTGHSKGGNLALYCGLSMRQELLDHLQQVISFNAPGITKDTYELYRYRIEDHEFRKKFIIFENENDCVSSFFEHIKEPYYIKSSLSCNNLLELYHNHNLYGMCAFHRNEYLLTDKKSPVPMAVYYFVNDFFVRFKQEHLQTFISYMDDYFRSDLSMFELYKVFLYHVSQYTNLFDGIDYEEVKTITFQDLINRRKSKIFIDKVKAIDPKETIQKVAKRIDERQEAIRQDLDISKITQGFIDNYELLMSKTQQNISEKIQQNNEFIINAIQSIRSSHKDEKEETSEVQDVEDVVD